MKKSKIMATLLTAAMVVGLLGGCGNTAEPATESAAGTAREEQGISEAASAQEESGEEDGTYYVDEDGNRYRKFDDVRLKMLNCWNGGFPTASDQYNNDVAKAIREKIGVTIEFEGINMSETEKLNMIFASGDMPDIVNAPYWGGTGGETGVIKKGGIEGRLIDIRDMVPNYPNLANAYDIGVISKKFLESDIDIPENNGARYILPIQTPGSVDDIAWWGYGVFVRGDVAKTLNVDPSTIKTSEELYDFMVQARDYGFKDVNGNDCITATTFANGWSYADYAGSYDAKKLTKYSLDENGNVTLDKLSENWVNKNLFIWKLVNEGILDKECFTTADERAMEKVGNGTALFTVGQFNKSVTTLKRSGLYDAHPEMRYVPVGPLNYSDGSALKQLEAEGRNGTPAVFFPTTCANIDAALTWMDYVNSKEGAKLICYGFEGDTYELNADGQPRMNADLTARYAEDSEAVKEELRDRGIGYLRGCTYVAGKSMAWFGESEPFMADAESEELVEYRKMRPVEVISGYPINAVESGYEGYQEFAEWAFDDTKENEYTNRAFFAKTEAEAREILEDYQNYLRTNQNGQMQEFLDYMTEQSKTRDDFVY